MVEYDTFLTEVFHNFTPGAYINKQASRDRVQTWIVVGYWGPWGCKYIFQTQIGLHRDLMSRIIADVAVDLRMRTWSASFGATQN